MLFRSVITANKLLKQKKHNDPKIPAHNESVNEDWWSDMSPDQQDDYIKKHPGSKQAKNAKKKEKSKEKVVKVSKKDVKPGNPAKMKGEEKIKKLTYSGSVNNNGGYEIKGNKLNVIGIRPRDKGFFVNHFTKNTGFRKANLYYDGVHWQGGKKF